MSRFALFLISSVALIVVSCGPASDRFRLEGQFRNFNQGELYLYNAYDNSGRIDTIRVKSGEFRFECKLNDEATYILLFPNFSELPIFAKPGKAVTLKADASHLKDTEVKGTDLNKAMTEFRLSTNELTPPEVKKAAKDYILKNPASPVAFYLLHRYFIFTTTPDDEETAHLLSIMSKAAPDNGRLHVLYEKMKGGGNVSEGKPLPDFSVKDTNGKTITKADLKGDANVIYTWAMWNYDSQSMQRTLQRLKKKYGSRLTLLAISMDADKRQGKQVLERDSISWSNVCDGRMWDTPIIKKLHLTDVPANLVVNSKGTIIAINLQLKELEEKIETILK